MDLKTDPENSVDPHYNSNGSGEGEEKQCSFCGDVPDHLICLTCGHLMCIVCALKEILMSQQDEKTISYSTLDCGECGVTTELLEEVQEILVSFLQSDDPDPTEENLAGNRHHPKNGGRSNSDGGRVTIQSVHVDIIEELVDEEVSDMEQSRYVPGKPEATRRPSVGGSPAGKASPRPATKMSAGKLKASITSVSDAPWIQPVEPPTGQNTSSSRIKNTSNINSAECEDRVAETPKGGNQVGADLNFLKLLKAGGGKSKNQLNIFKKKLSKIQGKKPGNSSNGSESCQEDVPEYGDSVDYRSHLKEDSRPDLSTHSVKKIQPTPQPSLGRLETDFLTRNATNNTSVRIHPAPAESSDPVPTLELLNALLKRLNPLQLKSGAANSLSLDLRCPKHPRQFLSFIDRESHRPLCGDCLVHNGAGSGEDIFKRIGNLGAATPMLIQEFGLFLHDLKSQIELKVNKKTDFECRKTIFMRHLESLSAKIASEFDEICHQVMIEKEKFLTDFGARLSQVDGLLSSEGLTIGETPRTLQDLTSKLISEFRKKDLGGLSDGAVVQKSLQFLLTEHEHIRIVKNSTLSIPGSDFAATFTQKDILFRQETEIQLQKTLERIQKCLTDGLLGGRGGFQDRPVEGPQPEKRAQGQLSALLAKIQSEKAKSSMRNNVLNRAETEPSNVETPMSDSFRSTFYQQLRNQDHHRRHRHLKDDRFHLRSLWPDASGGESPGSFNALVSYDVNESVSSNYHSRPLPQGTLRGIQPAVPLQGKVRSFIVGGPEPADLLGDDRVSQVSSFQKDRVRDPDWFKKRLKDALQAENGRKI